MAKKGLIINFLLSLVILLALIDVAVVRLFDFNLLNFIAFGNVIVELVLAVIVGVLGLIGLIALLIQTVTKIVK